MRVMELPLPFPIQFFDPHNRLAALRAEGDPPVDPGAGGGDPPVDPKTPPGDGSTAAPVGDKPPAKTPPPGWTPEAYDRQLDRQHRKIKELEGKVGKTTELEAENQRLRDLVAAKPKDPPAGDQHPPARTERRTEPAPRTDPAPVSMEAAEFNVEVRLLGERAAKEYGKEWEGAVANFQRLGGLPPQLMQGVLAYGDDAPRIMLELGKNPAKFQEIADLPQAKQIKALGDLARETAPAPAKQPPKRPSGAPAPVGHVQPGAGEGDGASGVDLYEGAVPTTDEYGRITAKVTTPVSDDAWYAERLRQKRESQGRPWSIGGRGART